MGSEYKGQDYTFIKQIVYDKFEQRTAVKYGNNTVNTYNYDNKLRRLKRMTATQSNNSIMLDNNYKFDFTGNITQLKNTAAPAANLMGGTYTFNYTYDRFNRLTKADGNFSGYSGTPAPTFGDLSAGFTLKMKYDELHNITQKVQTHIKNDQIFEPNNYKNKYTYSQTRPHQLEKLAARCKKHRKQ